MADPPRLTALACALFFLESPIGDQAEEVVGGAPGVRELWREIARRARGAEVYAVDFHEALGALRRAHGIAWNEDGTSPSSAGRRSPTQKIAMCAHHALYAASRAIHDYLPFSVRQDNAIVAESAARQTARRLGLTEVTIDATYADARAAAKRELLP